MDLVSETYHMDCLAGMKEYPDKYFDLAVVDPPYGIGIDQWDNKPIEEYWIELFRVSKNQIVWGMNHFGLPETDSFIFWDKKQQGNQARGELAWASFGKVKYYLREWQWDRNNVSTRFHICQKPINLYDWIYINYAEPGQKILDTHLGSGSNRIAAHKNGLHFVGFEIDEEYFYAQEMRFKQYLSQPTLFGVPSAVGVLKSNTPAQTDLWNTEP